MTTIVYSDPLVPPLLADGALGACRHDTLARLLPHLQTRALSPGETLFTSGDTADNAYLRLEGEITLHYGREPHAAEGLLGEEAGLPVECHQGTAIATSPAKVAVIPARELRQLTKTNPALPTLLQKRLLTRLHGQQPSPAPATSAQPVKTAKHGNWQPVVGWACALLWPMLILLMAGSWGLDENAVLFLAIFSSTVAMWVFSLVDDYVPGLFALFAILILNLAPPSQILSGFASDGFFLALSILGVSTVMTASGLSYRIQLWLLLKLPDRPLWRNLALFIAGAALTPVVPSANGRCALVAPLVGDMTDLLRAPKGGQTATQLAASAFTGATSLSSIFLTSKSVNFVVFGLLSIQAQNQFQWLNWLLGNLAVGVLLIGLQLGAVFLWYRNDQTMALPKGQVAAQLILLGKMTPKEWASLAGILFFSIGVATTALHKIAPAWMALALLYVLLLFGFLNKKEFKEKVDWPFLMYLGGLIGISSGFSAVGLDLWLGEHLADLGGMMRTNLSLFLLLLFAILFVLRLAMPINAAIVICATVFMPLAEIYGANPWIIGVSILLLGEMWFLPYQCSYYLQFREALGRPGLYDERSLLRFNGVMNGVKLLALYGSIPYWQWLGLL